MVTTKEDHKIIIELTDEENKIIDYFIEKRGPNFLDEYFNHFMQTRKGVREDEISHELFLKWKEQNGKLE